MRHNPAGMHGGSGNRPAGNYTLHMAAGMPIPVADGWDNWWLTVAVVMLGLYSCLGNGWQMEVVVVVLFENLLHLLFLGWKKP